MKKLCISLLALITLLTINSFADGWYFDGANWKYEDKDGSYVTGAIKKSNGISYYLDDDGNMATDYLAEVNNNFYYFDENGAMVTNTWVALDPSVIEDQPFDADVFYMYFGNNGKAIKGEDGKKKNIDGKTYMFNNNGIMMVGWMNENGEYLDNEDSDDWYSSDAVYFAREDGSLAEGWLPLNDYHLEDEITNAAGDPLYLETIWFYFDPTTHKKNTSDKSINGKKYYFFSDSGRMMTEWEYLENEYGGSDDSFIATNDSANRYNGYFNDGSLKKNEWIYAIPSSVIDSEAYDDYEYSWFYTKNNGGLIADTKKKINNKNYLFDKKGIMKTGLIVLYKSKYYCNIDLSETNYEDFVKHCQFVVDNLDTESGYVVSEEDDSANWGQVSDDGYLKNFFLFKTPYGSLKDFSLRYYGDDGAEKIGNGVPVQFNDGEYLFYSNNKGALKEWDHKKYYINGFLAKPVEGYKYGVMLDWSQICAIRYNGTENIFNGYEPTNSLTNNTYLDPNVLNYGKYTLNKITEGGIGADMLDGFFLGEHSSYGGPAWLKYSPYAAAKYSGSMEKAVKQLTPPWAPMFGGSGEEPEFLAAAPKNAMCLVNKSGKQMKKGVYKEDGNYLVVDNNKQFVGLFNVPIKWGKKTVVRAESAEVGPGPGVEVTYDWPYYKSDILDEDGETKDGQWIPFFTQDAYGRTELDYVESLSEEQCINFGLGTSVFE